MAGKVCRKTIPFGLACVRDAACNQSLEDRVHGGMIFLNRVQKNDSTY